MFHDDLNPIILFCTVLFFWPWRSLHDQDLTFSLHALPCKSWLLCKVSAALYTFTMAIPSLLYLDHVDPQTIPSLLYLDHGDPQKTIPWPWRSLGDPDRRRSPQAGPGSPGCSCHRVCLNFMWPIKNLTHVENHLVPWDDIISLVVLLQPKFDP